MKSRFLIYALPVLFLTILLSGYGIKDYPNDVDRPSTTINSQPVQNFLPVTYPLTDATCTYTWTAQTSGTTQAIVSISAVSDLVGWIACNASVVRKTVNGGTTWTDGNSTPGIITGDIYNIYALDANTAFCTTTPGATNIYRTVNGGTTWTLEFSQVGGFIDGIQMVNADTGYALGDPVGGLWTILQTVDGGDTWARMATEPAQVGTEAGWNNSFQVLGNHMWFGTNNTRVYHSTNRGLTWSSGATTGTINTFTVHFNDVNAGLAAGQLAASPIVKSINGGTTYTPATLPNGSGTIFGLGGSGSDWWVVKAARDTIYRSMDHGATWPSGLSYVQTGAAFQSLGLVTDGGCARGWAGGGAGAIAKLSATSTTSTLTLTINFEACASIDKIDVELRNTVSPFSLVETQEAVGGLSTPQAITFGNAANGVPYYIVVNQRASIQTWSKSGGETFTAGALSYDFTTAASQAFGSNQVLVGSDFSLYTGDVDQNGLVDLTDIIEVFNASTAFVTGYVVTDLNCDNAVTLTDVLFAYNNATLFVSIKRPL